MRIGIIPEIIASIVFAAQHGTDSLVGINSATNRQGRVSRGVVDFGFKVGLAEFEKSKRYGK